MAKIIVIVKEVPTMADQIYSTKTFVEVFDSSDQFIKYWKDCGLYTEDFTDDYCNTLYYLLYAQYGNSPIANRDVDQFRYKVFSIIYQYGPTWARKSKIQDELRAMSEEELVLGSSAIYNTAMNPTTVPSTDSRTPLTMVNQQNVTLYNKTRMEAYSILWEALKTNITSEFIGKFKNLFKQVIVPEAPIEGDYDYVG